MLRTSRRRSSSPHSFDSGSALRTGLMSGEKDFRSGWIDSATRIVTTLDFEDHLPRETDTGTTQVSHGSNPRARLRRSPIGNRVSDQAIGTTYDTVGIVPPVGGLIAPYLATSIQRTGIGIHPLGIEYSSIARGLGPAIYCPGGTVNLANTATGLCPDNWLTLGDWGQTGTTAFTIFMVLQPRWNGESSAYRTVFVHGGGILIEWNSAANSVYLSVGGSGSRTAGVMTDTFGGRPSVFCFSHIKSLFFNITFIHQDGVQIGAGRQNYGVSTSVASVCNFGSNSNRKSLNSYQGNIYYFEYWADEGMFAAANIPETEKIKRRGDYIMRQYNRRPFGHITNQGEIIHDAVSAVGRVSGGANASARVSGALASEGRVSGAADSTPRSSGSANSTPRTGGSVS